MSRLPYAAFLVVVASLLPSTSIADDLQAGIAMVDITPPKGYRMSGYFSERLSTGTKDPLFAKALVFRQGGTTAALVFCDIVGISSDVATRARQRSNRETGIPQAHIAICATHSHTGPLYFGALREHFHQRSLKKLGKDPHEEQDYPDQLVKGIVTAIKQAHSALQVVNLSAGYASENRLSFNRRFHMKNGSVRFNPGQLNPEIVRTAGRIDPQVGIVSISKPGRGNPLGAIISFALHLDTVGGTEYSADYPRFLQDRLRETFGSEFISMFGAGTCGDINHADVTVRGRRSAQEIGTMLGTTVAQRTEKLAAVGKPSLDVRRAVIQAPLQSYTKEEIARAGEQMAQVDSRQVPFLERVKAYKIMALQLRKGTSLPIEVQVFRLSKDVAIVTLPGEVFVDLGIAIKAASPFKTTLVIELTNDAPGYIPTRKAFAEGSYETVNSRVKPGGGELMLETAVQLLQELNR